MDFRTGVEPREVAQKKSRESGKLALVKKALAENPPGSWVVVADVDAVFLGDLAPVLDSVTADAGLLDVAFQRDESRSLHANAGLLLMRVSSAAAALFAIALLVAALATLRVRVGAGRAFAKRRTIGFLHPYCNDGGGGEHDRLVAAAEQRSTHNQVDRRRQAVEQQAHIAGGGFGRGVTIVVAAAV